MTKKNQNKKRIIVIGAGIVGVSSAIYLQREGHDVILIDKIGPAGGASYGNGGILVSSGIVPVNAPGLIKKAPSMLLNSNSPLFMRWSYLPTMLPWLLRYISKANAHDATKVAKALEPILRDSPNEHRALAKGTGAEKWIESSDYVFVYANKNEYKKDKFAWNLRKNAGFQWEEMDAQAFGNYDPLFANKNKFAIRLSEHGHLTDPGQYVTDLSAHMVKQGGELRITTAKEIAHENGKLIGVKTSEGLLKCDKVVIATGAWSKNITEKLGLNIPLESERGYHIELINPSITPRSTMMLVAGKFVITPMQGRLRCAGIVEFGGLNSPPSKAPIALLKSHIRASLPEIKYDGIETWMGHRPAPIDSIPFIGPIDSVPGVYVAFGHHHVGIAGGARTGRLVADLIENRNPMIDMKPYQVNRFTA